MSPPRQLRIWLLTCLLAGVGLYLLRDMLLPFIVGMAVAYLLDPIADRLETWGCSRTLATSLITTAFSVILISFVLFFLPVLFEQLTGFIGRVPDYVEFLRVKLDWIVARLQEDAGPEAFERLREAAAGHLGQAVTLVGRAITGFWSGGIALLNLLSLFFITPIVFFYLLRDWDRIVAHIDGWLPRDHAPVIRAIVEEIDRRLAAFVRGQAMVALILALAYSISLSLTGLEFGLVIGLGAGAISFIPYVGAIAGLIGSLGVALVQFSDDWLRIALVAGIFAAGQIVEGNFLTPKLVGERVGLHPVWVIFAILAGGVLLGFVGILLAVPVAAALGVLVRFVRDRYMTSDLYLGTKPPPGGRDSGE